jgi:hypothetical protein
MLRQSPLFQFRHGDHICVFYRSEEALREVLTPYIAEGLRRGERCFCAQKPHTGQRLLFDLRFLGIDTDDAIGRGALEIHREDEVYFPNRKFEPQVMRDMLMRSLDDAVGKGFTGFRTAGELSWAIEGRDECDQLLDYEHMVEECFPGRPATGLCQYDMSKFAPQVLASVIEAHRAHVSEGNPSPIYSGVSIRNGNYWSEIVADKLVLAPNFYYVVQQRKPSEVVGWGVAPSFESAQAQAEQIVREAN